MFVDHQSREFAYSEKFDAEIAREKEKYIFLKPQLFMNRSGEVVQRVMQFYKVSLNDVYIVHDDLDILLGKYKLQKAIGPKLHNGLSSVEERLGTPDFWRLRIGVENRGGENKPSGERYVLSDFTPNEKEIITSLFKEIPLL